MESTEKANFGPVSSRIGLEPLRSLGPLWGPFPGGGGAKCPTPSRVLTLRFGYQYCYRLLGCRRRASDLGRLAPERLRGLSAAPHCRGAA